MTNKELKEYLNKFPDDATVECIKIDSTGWENTYRYVEVTEENIEILDFRASWNNALIGRVFIRIGEE